MQRLFEKISSTENSVTEIKTYLKDIIAFKNMVHKVVYGNEKDDGLITKVSKCFHMQLLQWGALLLILGALIGVLSRI